MVYEEHKSKWDRLHKGCDNVLCCPLLLLITSAQIIQPLKALYLLMYINKFSKCSRMENFNLYSDMYGYTQVWTLVEL